MKIHALIKRRSKVCFFRMRQTHKIPLESGISLSFFR
jgi:hypothetical protein